ncbi:MAG: hypothetical protein K0U13_03420 [Chlamydiae bacterium]|nr:hypothetical protein [Chlamydiota bacterium]
MIKQLLLFAAVCSAIIYSYNELTDGYSLSLMRSKLPNMEQFASPAVPDNIDAMLDQRFQYLGKGCQFYAFGSEDGKYVLKFLKQKHLRQLSPFHKASNARRLERVERLFSSVQLAYEKLAEESGLLYIHLNRLPAVGRSVKLVDKVGISRTVALDEFEFILQKRAVDPKEVFVSITDDAEAKRRIDQLVELVQARCNKGIADRDRSFVQNVAFSQDGNSALFVDIGQLYEDEAILDLQEQQRDIKKRMGNLKHFFEKHNLEFSHLLKS